MTCDALSLQLRLSGNNLLDDVTMHIGQSEIPTGVAIRELRMVKSHQVQNRGVQIMNMNPVFHSSVAELIGAAVRQAAFDSATRHPD